MTVAAILVVAFAMERFLCFCLLGLWAKCVDFASSPLRFLQAILLGSVAYYNSVCPRNSLSDYLIRQTCLLPSMLGRHLGSDQPARHPHPVHSGLAALLSVTGTSVLGSRVRPLSSDHSRWNNLLDRLLWHWVPLDKLLRCHRGFCWMKRSICLLKQISLLEIMVVWMLAAFCSGSWSGNFKDAIVADAHISQQFPPLCQSS